MSDKMIFVLAPQGTNGHEAAKRWLDNSKFSEDKMPKIEFVQRNADLLPSLEKADPGSYAMVPIENGTSGFIKPVIGSWVDLEKTHGSEDPSTYRPRVVDGVRLPIHHYLLVHPTIERLSQLDAVCSYPDVFDQCTKSITRFDLSEKLKPMNSTAEAAFRASQKPGWGAIASLFSADVYGLKVLRKNMHDHSSNETQFHVVAKATSSPSSYSKHKRTAVLFWVEHAPGTVARALQQIGRYGGNMTAFHSVSLGKIGKYAMYVEFDMVGDTWNNEKVLSGLRQNAKKVFVLGSYPSPGV